MASTEHIGQFLAVVIAPNDIELIYGTNDKRRSFVNQVISQVDKKHLQELVKYNKLIDHEWDVYPQNTWTYLGSHASICSPKTC